MSMLEKDWVVLKSERGAYLMCVPADTNHVGKHGTVYYDTGKRNSVGRRIFSPEGRVEKFTIEWTIQYYEDRTNYSWSARGIPSDGSPEHVVNKKGWFLTKQAAQKDAHADLRQRTEDMRKYLNNRETVVF